MHRLYKVEFRGRQRNTMGHKGITSLSDSTIVGISISLYFVGKISLSPCRDALFILFSFLSLKTTRESSRHPSYSLAYCKELKYMVDSYGISTTWEPLMSFSQSGGSANLWITYPYLKYICAFFSSGFVISIKVFPLLLLLRWDDGLVCGWLVMRLSDWAKVLERLEE